jgi:hypothetical protein
MQERETLLFLCKSSSFKEYAHYPGPIEVLAKQGIDKEFTKVNFPWPKKESFRRAL